jgi:hypothetical protein
MAAQGGKTAAQVPDSRRDHSEDGFATGGTMDPSAAESLGGAGFRFGGLFFSILGRRVRIERMEKTSGDARYLVHSGQEQLLVGPGRFAETADLANKLQGCCANFFVRHGRIEIEERFDISAHRSGLQNSGTIQKKIALAGVARQRCCTLKLQARFAQAAQLKQKVAAHARQ